VAVVLAIAVLGGCGSEPGRQPGSASRAGADSKSVARAAPKTTPARVARPPTPARHLLVFFKRTLGADPLASQLTVYTNGQAVAVITNGGIDGAVVHKFDLATAKFRRLRGLVRHTHVRDTSCCNVGLYIYWVSARNGSHRLQQGIVPRTSRSLITELNAITDIYASY
jgi:hypothetical protein